MDALLPAFVAAFLAEIGDKTQLLAALLAIRFVRPVPVLAGIAVAALANALIAGAGGALLSGHVAHRPLTLLLALALIAAGAGAVWRQKQPEVGIYDRLGPFAASAVAFFILEFGDKTQFLTLAIAARAQAPLLAASGAAAGVLLAAAPAVALGRALSTAVPLGRIRLGIGIVFLLVGVATALGALRLW